MNCPKCNEYYPESNSYCPSCGSENPNSNTNSQPNYSQQNQNPYQQPHQYQNPSNSYAQFNQNPQGSYPNFHELEEVNSNAYVKYWKNAFNFKGRTRRRDYWIAFAINTVIYFALIMIFAATVTSAAFSYFESDEYAYTVPYEYFENYNDDSYLNPNTGISYDYNDDFYDSYSNDYYNFYYSTVDVEELLEIIEHLLTPAVAISFILFIIFAFVNFIPELAIAVRRLHDSGKSGAFYFICFIPYVGAIIFLVLMCLDSELGSNQYGQNPKGVNPPPMNFGGYQNQYMGYGYQQPNPNFQSPNPNYQQPAPQTSPVNYDDIVMPIDDEEKE